MKQTPVSYMEKDPIIERIKRKVARWLNRVKRQLLHTVDQIIKLIKDI